MSQFKDIKVKDQVWCIQHGWGIVNHTFGNCIDVEFATSSIYESYDRRTGKLLMDNRQKSAGQMLFWDEVDVVPPPRRLEVDTIVWVNFAAGGTMKKRHFSHFDGQTMLVFNDGRSSQTAYNECDVSRHTVWSLTDPTVDKDNHNDSN